MSTKANKATEIRQKATEKKREMIQVCRNGVKFIGNTK